MPALWAAGCSTVRDRTYTGSGPCSGMCRHWTGCEAGGAPQAYPHDDDLAPATARPSPGPRCVGRGICSNIVAPQSVSSGPQPLGRTQLRSQHEHICAKAPAVCIRVASGPLPTCSCHPRPCAGAPAAAIALELAARAWLWLSKQCPPVHSVPCHGQVPRQREAGRHKCMLAGTQVLHGAALQVGGGWQRSRLGGWRLSSEGDFAVALRAVDGEDTCATADCAQQHPDTFVRGMPVRLVPSGM